MNAKQTIAILSVLAVALTAFALVPTDADDGYQISAEYKETTSARILVTLPEAVPQDDFATICVTGEDTHIEGKINFKANNTKARFTFDAPLADGTYTAVIDGFYGISAPATFVVGDVPVEKYTITVSDKIENGKVTADKALAAAGETVTVRAVADAGYELSKLMYNDVEIEGSTFEMPAENVVIYAYFEEEPSLLTISATHEVVGMVDFVVVTFDIVPDNGTVTIVGDDGSVTGFEVKGVARQAVEMDDYSLTTVYTVTAITNLGTATCVVDDEPAPVTYKVAINYIDETGATVGVDSAEAVAGEFFYYVAPVKYEGQDGVYFIKDLDDLVYVNEAMDKQSISFEYVKYVEPEEYEVTINFVDETGAVIGTDSDVALKGELFYYIADVVIETEDAVYLIADLDDLVYVNEAMEETTISFVYKEYVPEPIEPADEVFIGANQIGATAEIRVTLDADEGYVPSGTITGKLAWAKQVEIAPGLKVWETGYSDIAAYDFDNEDQATFAAVTLDISNTAELENSFNYQLFYVSDDGLVEAQTASIALEQA